MMHPNRKLTRRCRQATLILACSISTLVNCRSARAANQTWDGGGANALWSNIANWLADQIPPGDVVSTNNADVAIFNAAIANNWGTSANPIIVDLNRNIRGINFDTGSGSYFIGLSNGNPLKLSSGGTIQILSTLTASTVATINAPLSIQGTNGTYTLANNSVNGSSLGGGTFVFGGEINSGATGAAVLTLTGSNTNTNTIGGVISNGLAASLGVTKNGLGTWALQGANTYNGTTTVNQGILRVNSSAALGDGSATNTLIFNGGTLQASGNISSPATRGVALQASTTVDTSVYTVSIAGAITGAGGITKIGAGTLTLSGANTYSGKTILARGTLVLDLGGGGSINSASELNLNGGTLQLTGTGSQTFNNLVVSAFGTTRILMESNQTLTFSADSLGIGGGQTLNFQTAAGGANASTSTVGTSVVAFTAWPSGTVFSPSWTVTDAGGFGIATLNASRQVVRLTASPLLPSLGASAGTRYRIDNNPGGAAIPGSASLTVAASQSALSITVDTTAANGSVTLGSGAVLSSDTWNFGGIGANTWQISGSAGGAGIRPATSGGNVQINNWNSGRVTFNTPILAFGNGAVSLSGTGTTVLAGANTYTGITYLKSGTLEVPTGGVIPAGIFVGYQPGNVATFELKGGSVSGLTNEIGSAADSVGTVNVTAGSWTASSSNIVVANSGTGVLNLSGGNIDPYGTIVGKNSGSHGTVNINGGTWTTGMGGTIIGESGTAVLNLSDAGTIISNTIVTLGANSTGTGVATVTGGSWSINSGGLVVGQNGTGVFNLSGGTVNSIGNVQVGSAGTTGIGTVKVSGGSLTTGSSNSVSIGIASLFQLSGTGSISSGSVSVRGTANVSGGVWTVNGSTPSFTVYSNGSRGLNLTDSGLIQVGGSGGTGTFYLGFSSGNLGTINIGTGGVAGTLKAATVTAFMGSGLVNFNHTNNVSLTAAITGNVAVNKQGSGTATLTGSSTYTAGTTVTAGTLLVSGSITGSLITVSNAGSTLGGTGTVANVTVNSGASLQGGDGQLASGALSSGGIVSLLDGSTIKLTLGTGGTHSSLTRTGGFWSFDGDQAFTLNFATAAETGFYNNIISGLTGSEAGLSSVGTWKVTNSNITGTFTYDSAGGVDLTITAIPEPGTASLFVLASLGLLGCRRWRRRSGAAD